MRSEQKSRLAPCGLLLLPVNPLQVSPFMGSVRYHSPAEHSDVLLMQATYHSAFFCDALFAKYHLPFPAHLSRAVIKRRAEYLASRVGARYALSLMGIPRFVLSNDADRAPVWPEGITGSLSHTYRCVSLLLAKTSAGKLLGIDSEEIMNNEAAAEMQSMIINPREREVLQCSELPFNTALTAAFSLKESLYKALFPRFRQFMDFREAEIVECSRGADTVILQLKRHLSAEFSTRLFTGYVLPDKASLTSWVIASDK